MISEYIEKLRKLVNDKDCGIQYAPVSDYTARLEYTVGDEKFYELITHTNSTIERAAHERLLKRVEYSTLKPKQIIDGLGEWLCEDMEKELLRQAHFPFSTEYIALELMIEEVGKRIKFYRDNVM